MAHSPAFAPSHPKRNNNTHLPTLIENPRQVEPGFDYRALIIEAFRRNAVSDRVEVQLRKKQ